MVATAAYSVWYVGFALAFAVVVVVVIVVATILALAQRVAEQAVDAADALGRVVDGTAPLTEIMATNASAVAILAAVKTTSDVLAALPAPVPSLALAAPEPELAAATDALAFAAPATAPALHYGLRPIGR